MEGIKLFSCLNLARNKQNYYYKKSNVFILNQYDFPLACPYSTWVLHAQCRHHSHNPSPRWQFEFSGMLVIVYQGQPCLLAHGDLRLAFLHQEGDVEHVLYAGAETDWVQDKLGVVDGTPPHIPETGDQATEHMGDHLLCLVFWLLCLSQHHGGRILQVRHHGRLAGGSLEEQLCILSEHDPLPPGELLQVPHFHT